MIIFANISSKLIGVKSDIAFTKICPHRHWSKQQTSSQTHVKASKFDLYMSSFVLFCLEKLWEDFNSSFIGSSWV